MSTYIANKWALIGLIESIAEEFSDRRVNINGLYPGPLDTKFLRRLQDLGSEVLGNELFRHVQNNIDKFEMISLELLHTIDFLVDLDFQFSGKVISARYDSIYTLEKDELMGSKKYVFTRSK